MLLHIVNATGDSPRKMIRFQWWILAGGLSLLTLKFGAYWLTNSNAILSDALESIVNVSAAAFALFSLAYSAKPKDLNHPYGHGKIEFLSSGLEGGLVIIAGLGISWKGLYNLFYPHSIENIDFGIYITAFAGLINLLMGYAMVQRGRREDSLLLRAGGKHLQTDAYTTVAMVLGLGAIFLFEWYWLDSAIAMVFGFYIVFEGYRIVRKSLAGIMDEADFDLLEEMVDVLEKHRRPTWIDVHNLRVIKYGRIIHVDAHLTIPWYFKLSEAHAEMNAMEEVIKKHFGERVEFFIHMEPCTPVSCTLCSVESCPERHSTFERKIPWELELLLADETHRLEEDSGHNLK
jgi:cation diffusion facilitator family transporter